MKKSGLQAAIDKLEGEIKVLQMAVNRMKAEQVAKPARVKKPLGVASVSNAQLVEAGGNR